VSRTAAGNQRDFTGSGRIQPADEMGLPVQFDDIGMGLGEAGETVVQQRVDGIDEFFHGHSS